MKRHPKSAHGRKNAGRIQKQRLAKKDARRTARLKEAFTWKRFVPRIVICVVLTVLAVAPMLWLTGIVEHPETIWLPPRRRSSAETGILPYTTDRARFLFALWSVLAVLAWTLTIRRYRHLNAAVRQERKPDRVR